MKVELTNNGLLAKLTKHHMKCSRIYTHMQNDLYLYQHFAFTNIWKWSRYVYMRG